jgi:hypothetical protein
MKIQMLLHIEFGHKVEYNYQGRLVGLSWIGFQQHPLLSHSSCVVPLIPQSILSLSDTEHLSCAKAIPMKKIAKNAKIGKVFAISISMTEDF